MKLLLTLFLNIILFSLHAQTAELDSLLSRADAISKSKNKELNQLSLEKSIRTDILNKLEFVLNAKPADDRQHQDKAIIQKLDSLIGIQYQKSLSRENTTDELEHRIALYDLVNTKDNWMRLEADDASPILDEKIIQAEITRQKELITKIDLQLLQMKTAESRQKEKKQTSSDELFNENSIVSQVIASNLESGKKYDLKIRLDNKGFEDRKAFMPIPLQNGNIKKRYAEASSNIIYSSKEDQVVSVCQGEVVYSKSLGGSAYTIVIMHNKDYYTVYSNLKSSFVSYGDEVNFKQSIGRAKSSSDGSYSISFEIWNKRKSQNPMHWIKNG